MIPPFIPLTIKKILLLFITCIFIVGGSRLPADDSLQIRRLHVPNQIVSGESVLLRCEYQLGGEILYSVKWYKNLGEFYRYVPASEPTRKAFPQVGIDVDLSKSDESSVFLRQLSLSSLGNYTCQVSTDAPFFRCVQTTRHLEVVVPPSEIPVLLAEKSDYELGDNVSIMCNSGRSKPAPDLQWYINGQLVHSHPYDKETTMYPDMLESKSLALRFQLQPEVLLNGKVALKCVATSNNISAFVTREIRASAINKGVSQANHIWTTWVIAFLFQMCRQVCHIKY